MSAIVLKNLPHPHHVFTDYYPSKIKNLYFTKNFKIALIEDNDDKTDLKVGSIKSKQGGRLLTVTSQGVKYNALGLFIDLFIETDNRKLKIELSDDDSISFNNFYYESQTSSRGSTAAYNKRRREQKELNLIKKKQEKQELKEIRNKNKKELLEEIEKQKQLKSFLIKNVLTGEIINAKNKKAIYKITDTADNNKSIEKITDDEIINIKKYLIKKHTSKLEFPDYTNDQLEVFKLYEKTNLQGRKTGYKVSNDEVSVIFAGSCSASKFLDCSQPTLLYHAANNKPIKGYKIEQIL